MQKKPSTHASNPTSPLRPNMNVLSDLKPTPDLILAITIIIGAIVLLALGKIDWSQFYTLIALAIGLIGGSVYQRHYLKSQGLLK